jgi:hypothetical protein
MSAGVGVEGQRRGEPTEVNDVRNRGGDYGVDIIGPSQGATSDAINHASDVFNDRWSPNWPEEVGVNSRVINRGVGLPQGETPGVGTTGAFGALAYTTGQLVERQRTGD